ncbi:MAG: DUF3618 domain-containing protein [Pseudonocardiaceae bacterium]|nr:DUF3618 domain-containing protein [Pseudonocardiaceae bacterium]
MARDTDNIEREIEDAREALASTLDELGSRANPKHIVDQGKQQLQSTVDQGKQQLQAAFDDPKKRPWLIGGGVLIGLLLLRKLVR